MMLLDYGRIKQKSSRGILRQETGSRQETPRHREHEKRVKRAQRRGRIKAKDVLGSLCVLCPPRRTGRWAVFDSAMQ